MSNDDGIDSVGLTLLAEKLSGEHNVLVVAPCGERSAFSHKLTMHEKLEFKYVGGKNPKYYSLSGSPADCIKFTLFVMKDFPVDLVIGGINRGGNIGSDIMYSGTCAVAREGAYLGIKSIALSLANGESYDFSYAADFAARNIRKFADMCCDDTFINVNFPNTLPQNIRGVRGAIVGKLHYHEVYHNDGDGYSLSGTLGGTSWAIDEHESIDTKLIQQNYITVTPVYTVKTNLKRLADIRTEELK